MSSRQIKWMREQLNKANQENQENIEEPEDISIVSEDSRDFSILAEDSSNEISSPSITISVPPPPPPKAQQKKKKQRNEISEEDEIALLLASQQSRTDSSSSKKDEFDMSSLNLIRELKTLIGPTQFDECLKLPKSSSALRFMSKRKRWPTPFPNYFVITPKDDKFIVGLTEYGESTSSIFRALQRINDQQGILDLNAQRPFAPPLFPIKCQQLLFDREFDGATEIAVRGLYQLQQSLPMNFVPLKSKLLPSPPRAEFLDLIAFLARFSFRRDCFQTSLSLWKFGLYLTDDDPADFQYLAAVPALYAGDRQFIQEMIQSGRTWRGIPLAFVPDYTIADALFELPDNIIPLANEIAKWPFLFSDLGMESGDIVAPEFLLSIGNAMRKRIQKYFQKPELESALEIAASLAQDIDKEDEIAIAMSYWYGITDVDMSIADIVEENIMPTG